jgi:hypothetical protein
MHSCVRPKTQGLGFENPKSQTLTNPKKTYLCASQDALSPASERLCCIPLNDTRGIPTCHRGVAALGCCCRS